MKKSIFNRLTTGLTALALVIAQVIMPVQAAFADEHGAPAGNNGTVKINDEAVADDPGLGNEPILASCTVNVRWYGFDAGLRDSTVTFESQSPTTASQLVSPVGPHDADFTAPTPTTGNTLSHEEDYTLAFSGAPAAQGYHVKATVYTDGSQGNDTKSKVFWLPSTCGPATPTPSMPTATATVVPCTPESGLSDKVNVTVTNTDDATDEAVTYTIALGGQTKTLAIADGETKNVEFGGLAAGTYTATVTGSDGTVTTNEVTVKVCEVTPVPAAPTARIVVVPCTPESGLSDKVSVIVTNTDDNTDATVTYTIVLGGQTKTLTLADGATGNVEFGGLAAGNYSATITGSDGTVTTDAVTVAVCTVTPPTQCTVSDNTFLAPWKLNDIQYPEAGLWPEGANARPGTYEFVNNENFTGIHLVTPDNESYVDGMVDAGNTPLKDVDAMSYITYRDQSSTGYAGTLPAYILLIDKDGNTADDTDQTYLFFEPYNNGAVLAGTWQTWDALNNGDAKWWMSGTGQTLHPWSYFVDQNPNATVVAYGFNQGTYNPGTDAYIKSMTFDCATSTFSAPGKGGNGGDDGGDSGNHETPPTNPGTPTVPEVPTAPATPGKGALPAELPETGSSISPLLIGLSAAAAAYGAVYFAQPKRRYE